VANLKKKQKEKILGDMTGVDIAEVILIVAVFIVGVGGFIYAALKED